MSFDMDVNHQTTDPTSDFLQREKEAAGTLLGGDEALFGTGAAAAQASGVQGTDDFERRAQEFPAIDDDAPFTDVMSNRESASVAPRREKQPALEEDRFRASYPELDVGHDDFHDDAQQAWESSAPRRMESDFMEGLGSATEPEPARGPVSEAVPERESELEQDMQTPTHQEAKSLFEPERASGPTPFAYEDIDEETEALRTWHEQQADDIARREAQAERHRAEAVSKAEQDIDQFYANYNAQKEKNIKKNKEAEARFLEQKQMELAEGTTWTRITKLLDLHNSQSKTIAKGGPGSSDLTRMKELYLRLRREGDKAPGAAGY